MIILSSPPQYNSSDDDDSDEVEYIWLWDVEIKKPVHVPCIVGGVLDYKGELLPDGDRFRCHQYVEDRIVHVKQLENERVAVDLLYRAGYISRDVATYISTRFINRPMQWEECRARVPTIVDVQYERERWWRRIFLIGVLCFWLWRYVEVVAVSF